MRGYSITQVAEQLGIKVHTIRYWEKHVPMLSVQRDMYGKRIYNRQDIYMLIRMKYYIENEQFTLKGAATALVKEFAHDTHSEVRAEILEVMNKLESQKGLLDEAKKLLQKERNTERSDGGEEQS